MLFSNISLKNNCNNIEIAGTVRGSCLLNFSIKTLSLTVVFVFPVVKKKLPVFPNCKKEVTYHYQTVFP